MSHSLPAAVWLSLGILIFSFSAPNSAQGQWVATPEMVRVPAAAADDVATIDDIIAANYEVISGPAGQPRDWARYRSLHLPGANLVAVQHARDGTIFVHRLSVSDYASLVGPRLEQEGFFEAEVSRSMERFGHTAVVRSSYEARRTPEDAEPFLRGINTYQLMNDGTRWWIVSVFWEGDHPSHEAETPEQ